MYCSLVQLYESIEAEAKIYLSFRFLSRYAMYNMNQIKTFINVFAGVR